MSLPKQDLGIPEVPLKGARASTGGSMDGISAAQNAEGEASKWPMECDGGRARFGIDMGQQRGTSRRLAIIPPECALRPVRITQRGRTSVARSDLLAKRGRFRALLTAIRGSCTHAFGAVTQPTPVAQTKVVTDADARSSHTLPSRWERQLGDLSWRFRGLLGLRAGGCGAR
jgi:hypothetical protein